MYDGLGLLNAPSHRHYASKSVPRLTAILLSSEAVRVPSSASFPVLACRAGYRDPGLIGRICDGYLV
jgi:hypothetical protein